MSSFLFFVFGNCFHVRVCDGLTVDGGRKGSKMVFDVRVDRQAVALCNREKAAFLPDGKHRLANNRMSAYSATIQSSKLCLPSSAQAPVSWTRIAASPRLCHPRYRASPAS